MHNRRIQGAVVAISCAAALLLLAVLAVGTTIGQRTDVRLFAAFQAHGTSAEAIASLVRAYLPFLLAALCLGLGVRALWHRQVRNLCGAVVVAIAPLLLTGWLRDEVIARPALGSFGYPENTLPSGHVSAGVGLAAAAVLLWPGSTRPRAARWALLVVAITAMASVIGHAHRPSDVVASILLVGSVAGLVVLVLDVPVPDPIRDSRSSS